MFPEFRITAQCDFEEMRNLFGEVMDTCGVQRRFGRKCLGFATAFPGVSPTTLRRRVKDDVSSLCKFARSQSVFFGDLKPPGPNIGVQSIMHGRPREKLAELARECG